MFDRPSKLTRHNKTHHSSLSSNEIDIPSFSDFEDEDDADDDNEVGNENDVDVDNEDEDKDDDGIEIKDNNEDKDGDDDEIEDDGKDEDDDYNDIDGDDDEDEEDNDIKVGDGDRNEDEEDDDNEVEKDDEDEDGDDDDDGNDNDIEVEDGDGDEDEEDDDNEVEIDDEDEDGDHGENEEDDEYQDENLVKDGSSLVSFSSPLSLRVPLSSCLVRLHCLSHMMGRKKSKRLQDLKEHQNRITAVNNTVLSLTTRFWDNLWFEIRQVSPPKNWSVFAMKQFQVGDPVTEYSGSLVQRKLGKVNPKPYVFDFTYRNEAMSIDAMPVSQPAGDGRPGMFINHSATSANIVPRLVEIGADNPHIIFFAIMSIAVGDELLYNYGDRSRDSLKRDPWLTK